MNDKPVDVDQAKTYGDEKVSRQFVWLAAALVAVGVLGISTYSATSGMAKASWAMAIAGLAWAGYELLVRSAFPRKALLELTPQGIRLRTVGDIVIPWREIHDVSAIDLTTWPGRTAPFPVKFDDVTVVAVSRGFYERSIIPAGHPLPSGAWDNTFIQKGETVQVALHHDVLPVGPEDLRREVAARWYAFRNEDQPAPSPPAGRAKSIKFRVNWGKKEPTS